MTSTRAQAPHDASKYVVASWNSSLGHGRPHTAPAGSTIIWETGALAGRVARAFLAPAQQREHSPGSFTAIDDAVSILRKIRAGLSLTLPAAADSMTTDLLDIRYYKAALRAWGTETMVRTSPGEQLSSYETLLSNLRAGTVVWPDDPLTEESTPFAELQGFLSALSQELCGISAPVYEVGALSQLGAGRPDGTN